MADIELTQSHALTKAQARTAVEKVAQKLSDRLGVSHHWATDTLHFEGSGAEGQIRVAAQEVTVQVDLGFMLKPMQSMVRQEAERYLKKYLMAA
ncbi:polyhydroxyalkanoic acid system family protein [Salisaeta longa]|uniref:polyhydroxyalkanoic acid system family protein n=1 Tax=Salisaeta longa TaxID=503170 RepID=UPI0003B53E5A|nr:polyhydroxyalkanoic acid system family protein [Salisaeta longa]